MAFVHVFTGGFDDEDQARQYSEPQWEPEPDESVSDADYAAWEDRNPHWAMGDEFGVYLDEDFIETIVGDDRYRYLATVLADGSAAATISAAKQPGDSALVLIFDDAFGGFDGAAGMRSLSKLVYHGRFQATF